ncbi:hypothetical protein D3C83_24710 [compost metagenome]
MAVGFAAAECAGGQEQHLRTQALAAAAHDVFGDLPDEGHAGIQPGADGRVHGAHVRLQKRPNGLHRHPAPPKEGGMIPAKNRTGPGRAPCRNHLMRKADCPAAPAEIFDYSSYFL